MKPRTILLLSVLLGLSLALGGAAQAQTSEPPRGLSQASYWPPQPDAVPAGDEAKPFAGRLVTTGDLASTAAPTIATGQPGLSYRYMQTFGETERAYFDDTAHLNYPYGLATDGNNVWIADSNGLRAVKYTSDGTFVSQIGKTGFRYGAGQDLQSISDVGVDSTGNIWLVDSDVSHVLKFDASGKYLSKLGISYDSGQSNDRFHGPHSIAFDSAGNIYVSDSWNDRIQVFKSDGSYLATIGTTGVEGSDNAHFCNPQHIAITGTALWVADSCNHRVQVFNVASPAAPVYLATIGVSGQSGSDNAHFDHPLGIAVYADRIYVADENNHRIQVFNRATGAYQATISDGWGQDNDHLRHPSDVAVDASGNIYVADWLNARVQQFNSSLAYVRTYGATGVPYLTDELHYNTPSGLAVASDGSIYVTEARGQRLLKLAASGAALWTVGLPGVVVDTDANDRLNNPRDVALAPSGLVYVADSSNDRIQIFNPDGSYYATLGNGWGTGNYQFKWPTGLFITADGTIYVADYNNQRVQVYNSNRVYVATLGVTDVAGSDNAHFQNPRDVVVDARGYIYVSENGNFRVQVFDANRNYVRTIGVTGEGGDGFDHLNGPHHLAVDAHNNLYVSSNWNSAVHVYNQDGAYLTTIGGSRGNRSGQLAGPYGLAFDAAGNLYIADSDNHRIQKFAPGTPGWRQVNINGFGDRSNGNIHTLTPFDGKLYAGTYNSAGNGAQLWRMDTATSWTQAAAAGFGITRNIGINHLETFNGQLYAGVRNDQAGAQIYRSGDGATWDPVVTGGFGDQANAGVYRFAVYNGRIYAGTASFATSHGGEIWRSSSGNNGAWERVVSGGFDNPNHYIIRSSVIHDGHLYFGTQNVDTTNYMTTTGGIIIRTSTGDSGSWSKVTLDGLGDINNYAVSGLASFNGYLYASTSRWDASGIQVWRCQRCDGAADWQKVVDNGFGDPYDWGISTLHIFNGGLYLAIGNGMTGMEVWRTNTGNSSDWTRISQGGFGDSNNSSPYYNNVATYNGRLYLGTQNGANGPEVWMKTLTADFTATPTRGAPPLNVQFTDTSSGDFTTRQWDFGDGATSTETNPTHTYTVQGTYAVTLTIGDGTDTSSITKPAYIVAKHFTYLPLVLRNWDPLRYDDFNDPAWDGSYNSAKWEFSGNSAFQAKQQGGALAFTSSNQIPALQGGGISLSQPDQRTLKQLQVFEGKLKMGKDHAGGYAAVELFIWAGGIAGHNWWTQCQLGTFDGAEAFFYCDVTTNPGGVFNVEYKTSTSASLDTWHTVRIETNPATAEQRFYLDNKLAGSHVPKDAASLILATTFQPQVTVWNGVADTTVTRYVDDVRITPVR